MAVVAEQLGELLKVRDVVRRTNLIRSTVFALMNTGELFYLRIGKCRRIPQTALDQLLARSLVTK
jgi:excisionase family DNA binding protein